MKYRISIGWGLLPLVILLVTGTRLESAKGQVLPDSGKTLPDFVIFAEASGFIPFDESYRINYQASLAGIPFEIAGGLCFPINASLSSMFDFRYMRRTAVYVPDLEIKTLEIEIGVRDYLEKEYNNELRLYGSAGLLLAQASATGIIDATTDGTSIIPSEVSKDYLNIGLGLGLGIEDPISKVSALYFGIHIGVYFSDLITNGGLGNIGGISICLGYRFGLGN